MRGSKAAGKAPMLPGTLHMKALIATPGLVANPPAVVVDVRSFGMPRVGANVRVFPECRRRRRCRRIVNGSWSMGWRMRRGCVMLWLTAVLLVTLLVTLRDRA